MTVYERRETRQNNPELLSIKTARMDKSHVSPRNHYTRLFTKHPKQGQHEAERFPVQHYPASSLVLPHHVSAGTP